MANPAQHVPVEGPRAFQILPNDHRGVVVSVAGLFIGYALMIIGMRLMARLRTMGIDDYLAVFATFCSIVQFGTVISGVSHSLGKSYDIYNRGDVAYVAKLLRASDILFLISLFVAKSAVIWLCRRLFSINQKAPRIICDIVLAISALWCIGSILAITIGCDEQAAIGLGIGSCQTLMKRWVIIGTIDAIIELIVLALAIIVVWPLRLSVSRRLSAISCFLFRLPIIVFIALHLLYLSDSIEDPNRGVALVKPMVFRQAELLFSLFSAAIPALNQYLRKFQTTGAATFGYSPGSNIGHSYGLKSIPTKGGTRIDHLTTKDSFATATRTAYTATVDYGEHKERNDGSADGQSLGRHNSEDLIIRKDVQYEIVYSDSEMEPVRRR